MVRRPLAALLLVLALAAGLPVLAADAVPVPPGNRSAVQPPIDGSSIARTRETKGSFEDKYKRVYGLLQRDRTLIGKIKKTAALYDIDPIHIIGAIVGEHTYNVDSIDSAQGYYIKALGYLSEDNLAFVHDGVSVGDFVARPEFEDCAKEKDDYDLWSCREHVWNERFRGRTVDGTAWPNDRFGRVFFQPFFAGQTFGLGQLNPLAALMVADRVHAVGGLPVLTAAQAPKVYHAIMDPDLSLHYMAASIRASIDAYRDIAGVDISDNPGLTATLYNIGDVRRRAQEFAALRRSSPGTWPRENYYGWFVNDRLDELEKLL
ncbi:DUF1402 family protein [Prosthecomicrobium pneumaticum]|uniref:DUF1402 domain-containing protein n=1 Tax=Prosthecomicrobium pneumaticum TaxID=81895 RepID=A0A7W9FNV8_9HYPH|nr:DUF1402 family protein [Prosthecomicrobium pneumaticum]MBB5754097.1 hypothetical protein [Prosthecomicrobium pneumaticum]